MHVYNFFKDAWKFEAPCVKKMDRTFMRRRKFVEKIILEKSNYWHTNMLTNSSKRTSTEFVSLFTIIPRQKQFQITIYDSWYLLEILYLPNSKIVFLAVGQLYSFFCQSFNDSQKFG